MIPTAGAAAASTWLCLLLGILPGMFQWRSPQLLQAKAELGHCSVLLAAAGVEGLCAESDWVYVGLIPLGCFESRAFDYKLSSSVGSCLCPFHPGIFIYIKYFKRKKIPSSLCSNILVSKTFRKGISNDVFYVSYFKGPFQLKLL